MDPGTSGLDSDAEGDKADSRAVLWLTYSPGKLEKNSFLKHIFTHFEGLFYPAEVQYAGKSATIWPARLISRPPLSKKLRAP